VDSGYGGSDPVAAYTWFCLAEACGWPCSKEIRKLEYQLSLEQILGAQLRAGAQFHSPFVPSAAEETARRLGCATAPIKDGETAYSRRLKAMGITEDPFALKQGQ
jgi:hypothetical protein